VYQKHYPVRSAETFQVRVISKISLTHQFLCFYYQHFERFCNSPQGFPRRQAIAEKKCFCGEKSIPHFLNSSYKYSLGTECMRTFIEGNGEFQSAEDGHGCGSLARTKCNGPPRLFEGQR
jgi:hypothetical protein